MRGISLYFLVTGVICVSLGMIGGIAMGASGDHSLAPAHAHLNLVGWVTMALFGIYYHLVPQAAESPLARVHYGLAVSGVVLMVPGIILSLTGGTPAVAIVGAFLTLASMLLFLAIVVRTRVPQRRAGIAGRGAF